MGELRSAELDSSNPPGQFQSSPFAARHNKRAELIIRIGFDSYLMLAKWGQASRREDDMQD